MLITTAGFSDAINAPVRSVKAKVELYKGETLVATYTDEDALKSIEIQRVGEGSKFFGFGVSHKANIKIIDVKRQKNISTANCFKIYLGVVLEDGAIEYVPFPRLNVTEVHRDEVTNELSITTYDVLHSATAHFISELELQTPYSIRDFAFYCAALLGVSASIPSLPAFNTVYPNGANLEGTEAVRDALTAVAEATQTIYFINGNDELVFKRLDRDGEADRSISKEDYIVLDSSTNRRLQTIYSTTELGDDVFISLTETGSTQYVRDNPFWVLREDLDILLGDAITAVGGMTINQFECNWRGDFSLEPGDKIGLVTKDNKITHSYLLNDTLSYDGSLGEKTEWSCSTDASETASNPVSLGDSLKYTYARVDKVNREITLVAGESNANSEALSSLILNTESIAASVQQIEKSTNDALDAVNQDIETLTKKVETTITAEDVQIQIKSELENGVTNVTTTTGFTFDEDGLTIAKTGSEMKTNIDEDGMSVFRGNQEVLTADNTGVTAYNLHAKTFLLVGEHSRFEDYVQDGEARTGCFWLRGY